MIVFEYKRNNNNGKCGNCNRYNTSPAWCQTCDPQTVVQGWTSGNEKIDDCIKEFQIKTTEYENVIECIPFNRLCNIQMISEDVLSSIFLATWLNGIRTISDNKQSRTQSCGVNLKTLPSSQNLLNVLEEFKDYMQLENKKHKVYGITQNSITCEYMIVFDEFYSKRHHDNGKCRNCNRYNTSPSWCQACDLQTVIQGWTSGNENIDDCIKEIQIKTTKCDDVIEWIPFDRLDNLRKNGEYGFGSEFSAIWLDGIRVILGETSKFVQSRTLPCEVNLLSFLRPQNLLNFLREFKDSIHSENKQYKIYGITQNTITGEYMIVFDKFFSDRKISYGKCKNCDRYNTSLDWCQTCGPWTSGNMNIDNCIHEYKEIIQWIPFHRLYNIQVIGKGGFGTVFSASWLNGKRINANQRTSIIVALKSLPGSRKNFLREFKNYMKLRLIGSKLEVYGLTRNADNEYLMVFQYANIGNLRNYLISNFRKFNWKNKLKILIDVTKYLNQIHIAGYIEESDSEGVYGVLPYVAPEVLNKQPYTTASDIYSFGVIMAEISTGKPPYYDIDYDVNLASRICKGLRPEFAKGIPECYIQLANQCMNVNPSCRPTASNMYDKLSSFWYYTMYNYDEIFKEALGIKKAFESADLTIPTLLTTIPNYSQAKFTSKLLNFKNLSNSFNSFESKPLNFQIHSNPLNSSFYDSTLQKCFISNNADN
ncbi:kinase-like domain-containing protein [Gigaspora rosea]|uniref:Kinase-like domain-containing protein n=1 Tax=Gigaspora rosea TaxID=44941 RepID=A0A397VWH9_9GLOM|nr:kinase-like domain-containing protein [Gigaspora rosea]